MYILINTEQEKCILNFIDRRSTVARKPVQNAETVITEEQEDRRNAENAGSTTWQSDQAFEEMFYAIRDSRSDFAHSNYEEDREDKASGGEDVDLGRLSEDGKPGQVMCIISRTGNRYMQRFWRK